MQFAKSSEQPGKKNNYTELDKILVNQEKLFEKKSNPLQRAVSSPTGQRQLLRGRSFYFFSKFTSVVKDRLFNASKNHY